MYDNLNQSYDNEVITDGRSSDPRSELMSLENGMLPFLERVRRTSMEKAISKYMSYYSVIFGYYVIIVFLSEFQ